MDDTELKQAHRGVWASGDYPSIVSRIVSPLGPVLVTAAGIESGQHVLDVAAGTGNAAVPAARLGARVVASDLTPELLETGQRQHADVQGLSWEVADAENLPYHDATFEVVMSCIGAMFAPRHRRVADELLRVCRPGGRIAMLNWTPDGFIGRLFAALKPFAAPPPPGASPPPLWGDEQHVRELLGDRVSEVSWRTASLPVTSLRGREDFRDTFRNTYGPVIAVYARNAESAEARRDLDRELLELSDQFADEAGDMLWEYAVLTATKR